MMSVALSSPARTHVRLSMKPLLIAVAFALSITQSALAANPTWAFHPDDTEQMKKFGVTISYRVIVNDPANPEYAFTITSNVPKGFHGLDAQFAIRNSKGLVALQHWKDQSGKCVADFAVGKQALANASYSVQLYVGERTNGFSASGRYVIALAEFANDARYCSGRMGVKKLPATNGFRVTAPVSRGQTPLVVEINPKKAISNFLYDVHVTIVGRCDQHLEIRNGQPLTKGDVKLTDLNGDGFLDIMIKGGVDHRGQDWFKTFIFDKSKNKYRWITERK